MIRLSASLSRKVPVPGIEYSSQQYGASMEIEISDADKPEAIQARIRELYGLLSRSIDEQIGQPRPAAPAAAAALLISVPSPEAQETGHATGQRTSRVTRKNAQATAAQVRAIKAISQSLGITVAEACSAYRVATPEELRIQDASRIIDDLKARQHSASSARR